MAKKSTGKTTKTTGSGKGTEEEEVVMAAHDEFEEPPAEEDSAESVFDEEADSESEFDDPDEEAFAEEAEDAESGSAGMGDFGDRLLDVHSGIESFLTLQVQAANAAGVQAMAEDAYQGSGNILGVGLGFAEEDPSPGCDPGSPAVNLYVAEPCSVDEAKAAVVDSMGVAAASSDDVPVNVVVTGPIDAQPHRFRIRPAPGGVSCGHFRITAGTLGCLARGRQAPRNRRLLILSNNHVLANSNNANFADSVIQPGRADGGVNPRDRIAILERFVPINFAGGANLVDCATAWAWPNRVRPELIFVRGSARRFFRISSRIVPCRRGTLVGKSGRTTQLTTGRITDCNVTIRVNYRPRVALFRDQIAIRGLRGDFSQGGDSGSIIWTWDRRRNPVGLLFAGGGGVTFANKIGRVLAALDINLFT